jgi:hypothetical protein
MRSRILLLAIVASCGGKPSATPSPAANREVRLLEADDPALSPVMFAAAKYVFNPQSSGHAEGFAGVYVNKRFVPSLTKEIARYVNSRPDLPVPGEGGLRFTSARIASDTAYVEMQFGPGGPTWCVPFVVDEMEGGWAPIDRSRTFNRKKPSKAGQCGA